MSAVPGGDSNGDESVGPKGKLCVGIKNLHKQKMANMHVLHAIMHFGWRCFT